MENKRHTSRIFFAETREQWPIMSVYERFEQIVAIAVVSGSDPTNALFCSCKPAIWVRFKRLDASFR
jgi:hypothetical protein